MSKTDEQRIVENPHKGHRARMKERYASCQGLEGFADHEVLELLLYYAIPQKDINKLCHDLIKRYGSLSAVFEAPLEDLVKVKGVGMNTAMLISMILPVYKRYALDKAKHKVNLSNFERSSFYAKSLFCGERYEVFYMICVDAKCRLIRTVRLNQGTIDETPIYPRLVVEHALNCKAHGVILAHNHPSGDPYPSDSDITTTQLIINALSGLDIQVLDHIIVAGEKVFGFSQAGILKKIRSDQMALAADSDH